MTRENISNYSIYIKCIKFPNRLKIRIDYLKCLVWFSPDKPPVIRPVSDATFASMNFTRYEFCRKKVFPTVIRGVLFATLSCGAKYVTKV